MKARTTRAITFTAIATAAIATATLVFAAGGYGPGMMGDPGSGYGPGMMGGPGSGYGPGMMGGRGGGYGPGMMGGRSGGYGPGMMGGPGGGYGRGMMGGPGMMGGYGYTDQQVADIKSTLGITADQEDAWNAYIGAVRGREAMMQSHWQAMSSNAPMTPEQRLAFHQQGYNQMQQLIDARRHLFDVLNPQQRAKADSLIEW